MWQYVSLRKYNIWLLIYLLFLIHIKNNSIYLQLLLKIYLFMYILNGRTQLQLDETYV